MRAHACKKTTPTDFLLSNGWLSVLEGDVAAVEACLETVRRARLRKGDDQFGGRDLHGVEQILHSLEVEVVRLLVGEEQQLRDTLPSISTYGFSTGL